MGNRWSVAQNRSGQSYLPVALAIIFVLLIVWLPLALRSPHSSSMLIWAMVALLLAVVPALMVWLTYRR